MRATSQNGVSRSKEKAAMMSAKKKSKDLAQAGIGLLRNGGQIKLAKNRGSENASEAFAAFFRTRYGPNASHNFATSVRAEGVGCSFSDRKNISTPSSLLPTISSKRNKLPKMEQIAQQFTDFYYSTFDSDRNQLVNLYVRASPTAPDSFCLTLRETLPQSLEETKGLILPLAAAKPQRDVSACFRKTTC